MEKTRAAERSGRHATLRIITGGMRIVSDLCVASCGRADSFKQTLLPAVAILAPRPDSVSAAVESARLDGLRRWRSLV
jgi:hypothetical protein